MNRMSIRANLLCPALTLLFLACAGCQEQLDSVQQVIDRHKRAVARLPEEDRAQLMPYGAPVATAHADTLLPDGPLSLEECRRIAVRANPDVHAAQARFEAALARVDEARSAFMPTITATHNSRRTFHTPASRNRLAGALQTVPETPVDVLETTNPVVTGLISALRRPLFGAGEIGGDTNSFSEHQTALTATWVAFDGFAREARLMASKYQYKASLFALADIERLIIQLIDTAFYQVQLAQEQIRIALADERFSREQLELTRRLRTGGRATVSDVNSFEVRVLAAQANLVAAENLKETGRIVLAELMGMPSATLPEAIALPSLGTETDAELKSPEVDRWVELAFGNRPDIFQLEQILKSREEEVRVANAAYSPTLQVSGSYGFDRTSNLKYSNDDQSSGAAVEMRWDVYTFGRRAARVRQARANRGEAAANLNRRRVAVHSEIRSAVIDVQNSQEQIRLQRSNLEVARTNRELVQTEYEAGTATLTRLNEVQRDYIAADVNLASARIQLRQAWSDLAAAAALYRESIGQSPAAAGAELDPDAEE